jgi:hypothetical protein
MSPVNSSRVLCHIVCLFNRFAARPRRCRLVLRMSQHKPDLVSANPLCSALTGVKVGNLSRLSVSFLEETSSTGSLILFGHK